MIPLGLITGFLGSGKTTLLRRIHERYRNRKIVYLVNEFSAIDVDGRVLQSEIGELVALPGGSIFCVCLVGEFIRVLQQIPERFGSDAAPIEGVVIEASGIANPKVIEQMLRETQLDRVYAPASVIAVVDPATFPTLLQTLPNIIAQIECSDRVIINKSDLFDSQTLDDVEAEVRGIHPTVAVYRAAFCDADIDPFAGHFQAIGEGEYAKCVDPNYAKASVRYSNEMDLSLLADAIRELDASLYRAKGFIQCQGTVYYLDATVSGVTMRTAPEYTGPLELAFIVKGTEAAALRALVAQIKSGAFDARQDHKTTG